MAVALARVIVVVLAAMPAGAVPIEQQGHQLECVGDRAHLLKYHIAGTPGPDQNVSDMQHAVISLEPSPQNNTQCVKRRGNMGKDTPVCVGANHNKNCTCAKSDLHFAGGLTCKDCFVGVTTDLYYNLNYSHLGLHSVEVGLRDMKVRTAAALGFHKAASEIPAMGSIALGNGPQITLIDTVVGCPVCLPIKIAVSTPASLNYTLRLDSSVDSFVGAQIDVALGDQAIGWDGLQGFSQVKHTTSASTKPILAADVEGAATMDLHLNAAVLLNVNNIMSFRMNLKPSSALRLSTQSNLLERQDKVCLEGDAAVKVSHEADLHWSLFGIKINHHWEPNAEATWLEKDVFHACTNHMVSGGRRLAVTAAVTAVLAFASWTILEPLQD